MRFTYFLVTAFVLSSVLVGDAQTVQLPTYRVYSTNTTVSVPDRGAAPLSGNSSARFGARSSGVPILGRVPGLGRGFQNRAIGQGVSASRSWVTAEIIDHREWDEAVLAEARRRRGELTAEELKALEFEREAAFLSQHVGRTDNNQALAQRPNNKRTRPGQSRPQRREEPPLRLGPVYGARPDSQ